MCWSRCGTMHSKQPCLSGISRQGVDTRLYNVVHLILFSLVHATARQADNGKLRFLEQRLIELSNNNHQALHECFLF